MKTLGFALVAVVGLSAISACSSQADPNDRAKNDTALESKTMGNLDGILMGGYPTNIEACMGKSSLTPMLVENTTSEPMTITYNLDEGAAQEVAFYIQPEKISCGGQVSENAAGSFVAPAQQTSVFYAAAGGGAHAASAEYPGNGVNIGLNNQGGTFAFNINVDRFNNGFKSFTLNLPYVEPASEPTVGVASAASLNVQNCVTSNGKTVVGQEAYAGFRATSGQNHSWGLNQPICFFVSS